MNLTKKVLTKIELKLRVTKVKNKNKIEGLFYTIFC